MTDITLTTQSTYKSNDDGIIRMSQLMSSGELAQRITLDISKLRFIEIGPLALMLGYVRAWKDQGKTINVKFSSAEISYLQRIDFLKYAGVDCAEKFVRREARSRFVEFKPIESGSHAVDVLSDQIATCISGPDIAEFAFTDTPNGNGYYDAIAYSVSELMKNVQQHAQGPGFVVAQHYPSTKITQIAIFDTGIGVRASFTRNSSPHSGSISNDLDALKLAIQPEVSSKTHQRGGYENESENAGVGLTLLTEIAVQSGGSYQLASGNAILTNGGEQTVGVFAGTFVCLSFSRESLNQFESLLESAKTKYLGPPPDWDELNDIFR